MENIPIMDILLSHGADVNLIQKVVKLSFKMNSSCAVLSNILI